MAIPTRWKNHLYGIQLQGTDNFLYIAEESEGEWVELACLGIEPIIEMNGDIVNKIGGKIQSPRSYNTDWIINFAPFGVKDDGNNSFPQYYDELNTLVNSVLTKQYIYLRQIHTFNSSYLGTERDYTNIDEVLIEPMEFNKSSNYDEGSETVTLKFRITDRML